MCKLWLYDLNLGKGLTCCQQHINKSVNSQDNESSWVFQTLDWVSLRISLLWSSLLLAPSYLASPAAIFSKQPTWLRPENETCSQALLLNLDPMWPNVKTVFLKCSHLAFCSSGERRLSADRLQSHPAGQEEEAARPLVVLGWESRPRAGQREQRLAAPSYSTEWQVCLCGLFAASSGSGQRKAKVAKASPALMVPPGARFGDGASTSNGGLTLRDPVTGAQYVQIQLLQVSWSSSAEWHRSCSSKGVFPSWASSA